MSHLLLGDGGGALGAGDRHGGLEQGAFQEDPVVVEGLVDGPQHLLLHLGRPLDGVVTVHEDLGLDDGHQSRLLHGARVAGKAPGVLLDGQGRGAAVRGDLQHGSPLGEAGALGVVGSGALLEAIEARAPRLHLVSAGQGLQARVHLDAGKHAIGLEDVDKGLALGGLLEKRLLVQDGPRDVLAQAGGREEQPAVGLAGLLAVLHADALQALANRLGRLVHGKDALA